VAGTDATTGAAQVADLEARVKDLEDQWRRALADADNVRKRCARDIDRARSEERARVAAVWLPVIDHLEMALAHAEADPAAIVDGVRSLMTALGFPRDEEVGTPFDPARHEAVTAVPDADVDPGTVLHVVRPGYGRDDHQLRPASVVVATRAEPGQ
jgi:molecular chaperone GrpE